MSAEAFLDELENQGLLEPQVLAALRKKAAASPKPIAPAAVAKYLIDQQHLTPFQAKNLLAKFGNTATAKPAAASTALAPAAKTAPAASDDLDLAPLEDEPRAAPPAKTSAPAKSPSAPAAPVAKKTPAKPTAAKPAAADVEQLDEDDLIPLDDDPLKSPGRKPAAATASRSAAAAAPAAVAATATAPLDDLFDDPLMSSGAAAAGNPLQPAAKSKGLAGLFGWGAKKGERFQAKRGRKNQWDSPLVLVGGGAFILLLGIGIMLLFVLGGKSSDELYKQADDAYRSQSYAQAISGYDRFLASFPNDPQASAARVRRGMAALRQQVDVRKDWDSALAAAKEVLPTIENEPAFADARAELATLLPDIAGGFAARAKTKENTEAAQQELALAAEALQLVDNSSYIPTSFRRSQQTRIDGILADVAAVERNIGQEAALAAALEQIKAAIGRDDTAAAFALRRELLRTYPVLANDDRLRAAVLAVAEKERALVAVSAGETSAVTEEHPSPAEFTVVLAATEGSAANADNQVVAFLASGAVYAFDAASGKVLWRRYVGLESTIEPVQAAQAGSGDLLLVDGRRQELLRVEAATGKLVWRLPLGDACSAPIVANDRALLALHSGKLWQIELGSGRVLREARLPMPLAVAPAVDIRQGKIYLPGVHSNVYVLSLDSLACEEVFYLGHAAGTLQSAPIVVLGHVFLSENAGRDFSFLHVLAAEGTKSAAEAEAGKSGVGAVGEPIRLPGRVLTPMLAAGNRTVVVTDRRSVHVYEVDPSNEAARVRSLVPSVPTATRPVLGYAALVGGQLWIADERFTKYELQFSRGELVRKWGIDDGETFLGPPQIAGNVVCTARVRPGSAAVWVSAVGIGGGDADGKRVWETRIAVPPAGEPLALAQPQSIVSVSSLGDVYTIDANALRAGSAQSPQIMRQHTGRLPQFTAPLALSAERRAYGPLPPEQSAVLLDTAGGNARSARVAFDIPADSLAASPAPFDGGLLAPVKIGQIFLLDPQSGKERTLPFQPQLEVGETLSWGTPVALTVGEPQFVAFDGRSRLFRVGIAQQPRPHLSALAQASAPAGLRRELAGLGDAVAGIVSTNQADTLVIFAASDFSIRKEHPLGGTVAWGPVVKNQRIFVHDAEAGLVCFDAAGEELWRAPAAAVPAGEPLDVEGDWVFAFRDGTVSRLKADTGETLGAADVGEPLATGAALFGKRLLLSGTDGTLYVLALP